MSKKVLPENCAAVIIRGDQKVNYNVWASFVNYLTSRYNLKVFFLYTCRAHDRHVFRKLSRYCSLRELEMEYDYPLLISILRKMKLLMTDRYHAAIFSI